MKKIFSLALMATALLISGQVKAGNVAKIGTTEYATLQEAVNAVPRSSYGDATTIELIDNINLNTTDAKSVVIYDRNILLKLNGFTYENAKADAFDLIKGKLEITGTGIIKATRLDRKNDDVVENKTRKITTTNSNFTSSAIRVYGSKYPTKDSTYTELIIGKDVIINGSYRGIDIYTWGAAYTSPALTPASSYAHVKTSNDLSTYFSGLKVDQTGINDYNELALESKNLQSACNSGHYGYAFGVKIEINGKVYGGEYGMQVSGVVGFGVSQKEAPLYPVSTTYYPVVNVNAGSEVGVSKVFDDQGNAIIIDGKYPTGIYASNFGVWTIEGSVFGATGINMKSGTIAVQGDAEVTATGVYAFPTSRDGGKASGDAIVVASTENRDGSMNLTISGSATLTSKNGYAVEEDVISGENHTESITITGGNFIAESSDKQAVYTSELVQNQIVNNGTITGGTYTDDNIKDYLPAVSGLIVVDVDKETGETVYIIGGSKTPVTWENKSLNDVADGAYVQIKDNEYTCTLSKDVNIAYLSMADAEENATVTIPAGKVLTVGEIVMGANAQIVVEAGGKLIVNSTNGIVAFDAANLIIKADATNGMGTFVLNPEVKGNKTPWATVEYMSSPFCGQEQTVYPDTTITLYHWEVVASPFALIDTIITEVPSGYQRVVDGAFVQSSKKDIIKNANAFDVIAMCHTQAQSAKKYTFKGKLQGVNNLSNFPVAKDFNYMGNAYMGKLNAKEMVQELQQSASAVRTLVYLWDVENMRWNVFNGYKLSQLGNVNPMAAIVLYSDEAGTVGLNYEKLIWNTNK